MTGDTSAGDDHAPYCYPYPRPALTVDIVVLRSAQEPSLPQLAFDHAAIISAALALQSRGR
jgi:hypothetical protein